MTSQFTIVSQVVASSLIADKLSTLAVQKKVRGSCGTACRLRRLSLEAHSTFCQAAEANAKKAQDDAAVAHKKVRGRHLIFAVCAWVLLQCLVRLQKPLLPRRLCMWMLLLPKRGCVTKTASRLCQEAYSSFRQADDAAAAKKIFKAQEDAAAAQKKVRNDRLFAPSTHASSLRFLSVCRSYCCQESAGRRRHCQK